MSKDDDQDKDESGDDGESGRSSGGILLPNYRELITVNEDEKGNAELAAQSLFEQRISVKSKGYEVTALSKMQKLRNRLTEHPPVKNDAGSGLDLAAHPELAELGGDVDPDNIVLPDAEALERASSDPKLQNKLRARMAAKMGMSQYISENAMKEEYRKKMRARVEPDQPRFRPSNAPKPRPN